MGYFRLSAAWMIASILLIICTSCIQIKDEPISIEQKGKIVVKHNENKPYLWLVKSTIRSFLGQVPYEKVTNYYFRFFHAIDFADFNGDCLLDIVVAGASGSKRGVGVLIFLAKKDNNSNITYEFATEKIIQGEIPKTVHARKAITADFNGDMIPDVYIADHGYDRPPFPGSPNVLLLSNSKGKLVYSNNNIYSKSIFGTYRGSPTLFTHGTAAGDIDNDGDVDIFVTSNMRSPSYFLLNDSKGLFKMSRSGLPCDLGQPIGIFTSNLIDLDSDGNLDLVVGGHGFQGMSARIYWGSGNGDFSAFNKTNIKEASGFSIVVDFASADFDKDGNKDLIVNRTRQKPFYQGYYIQLLINKGNRKVVDETTL